MVKNSSALPEAWNQSLGGEDPEEEMATHSSILVAWWATAHGVPKESDVT